MKNCIQSSSTEKTNTKQVILSALLQENYIQQPSSYSYKCPSHFSLEKISGSKKKKNLLKDTALLPASQQSKVRSRNGEGKDNSHTDPRMNRVASSANTTTEPFTGRAIHVQTNLNAATCYLDDKRVYFDYKNQVTAEGDTLPRTRRIHT